jgi:flavin-dependent dehydrogenase
VDGGLLTLNHIVERCRWTGSTDKLAFLRAHLRQAPRLETKLRTATVVGRVLTTGPLAAATREQTFDGAALVGDACGFVDPLTGEGLYYAMRGAALLAPVLDAALAEGRRDRGALRAYAWARRREFGPRTALARGLQRLVGNPPLAGRILGALGDRPGLMDLLLTVTGDAISPLRVLQPRALLAALRRSPDAGIR